MEDAKGAHRDIVVGVYDTVGRVAKEVVASVEAEVFIAPMATLREAGHTIESQSFDKEFFLERSTHVVIVVTDITSVAIFAGALNRLFEGLIRAVMIIAQFPVLDLLESMADPEEHDQLHKCIKEGRCLILDSFNPEKMHTLLSSS
jgi:hypothetical protein